MRLLFIAILMSSLPVEASRLIEIEDYFTHKASRFIETRYPDRAFTVYAKVEGEEKPEPRKPASLEDRKTLTLPYLETIDARQLNFWDRKDISLGTMISYLKSIYLKIDVEGPVSAEDLDLLKTDLFQHLKLSPIYDRVEVSTRSWPKESFFHKYKVSLFIGAGLFVLFLSTFFFIFRNSVHSLVQGLAQPLSEIGRSAESVARTSGLAKETQGGGSSIGSDVDVKDWLSQGELTDFKSEVQTLRELFQNPTGELLTAMNTLGESDPATMGAYLSLIDIEVLKPLLQWSNGAWWRVAITQPGPFHKGLLSLHLQFKQLARKQELMPNVGTASGNELSLALSRLDIKNYGSLFEGTSFEQAMPYLSLLPKDRMITVAKYLYPGRWAELLVQSNNANNLQEQKTKSMLDKALKLVPRKTESEIALYFRDAELLRFLDMSSTKDERDVYKTLPDTSWVKKERTPFYNLFQANESILARLANDVAVESWAMVIDLCDRQECDVLFKHFSSRQKYVIKELREKFKSQAPTANELRMSKMLILNSYLHLQTEEERNRQDVAA